ncbi:MAG: 1-deoxy-D-xylulose-5-phosphate synthase [Lachnospiraceae bacterium]|nr:1-deoxy-D-xylulose-5-phosphate synthase [Lachnospiraceae bacterium]
MTEVLSKINAPNDVKAVPEDRLPRLAAEIRKEILTTVSRNGGHLASNLGAVELTIALHRFLTFPEDKLVWDVGHQCYAHKLLTGRREQFATLRRKDGLSGFPKVSESVCDSFDTGHSSTSLSVAAGLAKARDLQGGSEKIVAVIGDGSLSGGMAYEALNNIGRFHTNVIVILNDNEMSISRNVGGLANYLGHLRMSQRYLNLKDNVERKLAKTNIGEVLAKGIRKTKDSIRQIMIPGDFFEELGLTYFGPVDGHSIADITMALQAASKVRGGVLIHVTTKKGKGYSFAEESPSRFHGIAPFRLVTGQVRRPSEESSYTEVFGQTCVELGDERENVVFVTAAMAGGTGLSEVSRKYPGRFFDVGIAEEHAVTFAAGMAAGGMVPVVAIYSTFLQRAYDQLLEDVCLNRQHVILAIDRAGLVADDGETHQGVYDIGFLSQMPGMTVMAPANGVELSQMLRAAVDWDGPAAIRYPKGTQDCSLMTCAPIRLGRCSELTRGSRVAVSFLGPYESTARKVAEALAADGITPTIANARFAVPFDAEWIRGLAENHELLVTIEEGCASGGYGEAVASWCQREGIPLRVLVIAAPKEFFAHASRDELLEYCGLTAEAIVKRIRGLL